MHWTSSPWTVVAAALFAFVVLAAWGMARFGWRSSNLQVATTRAYQDGVRRTEESRQVQGVLGDHIRVSSAVRGTARKQYGSQFAEWQVALTGSRATGTLYGSANEINGNWEYSRLVFIPDTGGGRIELAPRPELLDLPPVPGKKVVLVPLDLNTDESLDWAPEYYQAKLGIGVSLGAAMHAEASLIDARRRQLDSEKCVEYLRRQMPELAEDPATILIAVTSRDMFIPSYSWQFAENYRYNGRFAVVSSARMRSWRFPSRGNSEWLGSRLQKLLTKNIVMLYFDLPMSSDYTSLLSGGVLTGEQVDFMSGSLVGAEGRWDSFVQEGEPEITIYDSPSKPALWRLHYSDEALPNPSAQVLQADVAIGLFIQRQMDFHLGGTFPLELVRVYRNQDEESRAFGIGTNDSLDIFLVGKMGSWVDLILADGGRAHFVHSFGRSANPLAGDVYVSQNRLYTSAVYKGDMWTISRKDGWKLYLPYRPKALPQNVTVLTGFSDPAGNYYKMERDSLGDLISVTAPSGEWLRFEHDAAHRVKRVDASTGRSVHYEYDVKGCLARVTDSQGNSMNYTYDSKMQMRTIAHGNEPPVLTNSYDEHGYIKTQVLASEEKFEYHYVPDSMSPGNFVPSGILEPNGRFTSIQFSQEGYTQSLPTLVQVGDAANGHN